MSAVWVVRDASGQRQRVFTHELPAQHFADRHDGSAITREALLTPEMAHGDGEDETEEEGV